VSSDVIKIKATKKLKGRMLMFGKIRVEPGVEKVISIPATGKNRQDVDHYVKRGLIVERKK